MARGRPKKENTLSAVERQKKYREEKRIFNTRLDQETYHHLGQLSFYYNVTKIDLLKEWIDQAYDLMMKDQIEKGISEQFIDEYYASIEDERSKRYKAYLKGENKRANKC